MNPKKPSRVVLAVLYAAAYLIPAFLVCGILVAGAATITTIQSTQTISSSRTVINTNFQNLNKDKVEIGGDLAGGTTTPRLSISGQTAGALLYFGTSTWRALPTGTATHVLTMSSTNTPHWVAAAAGSGSVSTSSPITAFYFPYWATVGGGLSGTSTVFQDGLNVGILTTQPSTTLHVVGTGRFTGALAASSSLDVEGVLDSRGGLKFVNVTGTGNLQAATAKFTGQVDASSTVVIQATTTARGNLVLPGQTASRCARFDGSSNLVAAGGDCVSGDTVGGGGATSTRYYSCELTPGRATLPNSSFPSLNKNVGTNWVDRTLDFANGTTSYAYWQCTIPEYVSPVSSTLQIVWRANSASSTTWVVKYRSPAHDQVWDATTTPSISTASSSATSTAANDVNFTTLTLASSSFSASTLSQIQIYRDSADSRDVIATSTKFINAILNFAW